MNERPPRTRAEREADMASLCIEDEARIVKCMSVYAPAVVDARVRSGEKGQLGDSARRDRGFAILEQKELYTTYTPALAAAECRRLAPTATDEDFAKDARAVAVSRDPRMRGLGEMRHHGRLSPEARRAVIRDRRGARQLGDDSPSEQRLGTLPRDVGDERRTRQVT